jgi:hypothetical protein
MTVEQTKDILSGAAVLGIWVLPLVFICGLIGAFIGMFRQRRRLGLVLGATLGPLGWLMTVFLDPVPPGKQASGGCFAVLLVLVWLSGFGFAARATGKFVREKFAGTDLTKFNTVTALKVWEAFKTHGKLELPSPAKTDGAPGPPGSPAPFAPLEPKFEPEPAPPASLTPDPINPPRLRVPITPKPTPTAAEVQAEILRKYGTPGRNGADRQPMSAPPQ